MDLMFRYSYDFNQPLDDWNVASVTDMAFMFNNAYNFNQCLSSWAEKTPATVITYEMFSYTLCPHQEEIPDPNLGPWCQGVNDGCIVGTLPPTASRKTCINSDEINCAKFLKNRKQRGKKCAKVKNGEKVKNLCPQICKKFLCTCVDNVNKFTIKGKKDKKFTCTKLKNKKKNCKKKSGTGFSVRSICPNKMKNKKKNCKKKSGNGFSV